MQINRQAFTLIELLVVVLIIGILAAVALPQYRLAVLKSRYATVKNLTNSLAQAEEVYYLANGKYTESLSALDIDLPGNVSKGDYYYSNGDATCRLSYNEEVAALVKCRISIDSELGVEYQINLAHSLWKPNQRICVASTVDMNKISNKLCKAETGASPNRVNTYTEWMY